MAYPLTAFPLLGPSVRPMRLLACMLVTPVWASSKTAYACFRADTASTPGHMTVA